MRAQRLRHGPSVELIDEHAAVVDVRILEADQREHRRSRVRVIGPRFVVTVVTHAGADDAEPGRRDLRLDAAVVPRERRTSGASSAR